MIPVFSPAEIQELLQSHPEWRLQDGKLVRDWTFNDFVAAMQFVNRIAALAETAGHHPDIDIRYNQVRIALVSHDAGGITRRDAAMVETIDSFWSRKVSLIGSMKFGLHGKARTPFSIRI